MSGGVRYWNEETQRWEDGDGSGSATGPVTPPPPPRPDAMPSAGGTATPSAEPTVPVWPPAAGAEPDARTAAGSGSAEPPAPSVPPPPAPPAGWPGAGDGSTWHGPGTPGGGWSSAERIGGGSVTSAEQIGNGSVPSAEQIGGVPSAEWSGAAWSTAGTAVAEPSARKDRRVLWSALAGVAAVGVTVALVLTFVVGGGDEDDKAVDASPTPTGAVSQQSGPDDSPTPSPTGDTPSPLASTPELPPGYELFEDAEGFRIARPLGWSRTTKASQYGIDVVNYRSADGERRLQVYQVAEESPEASFELYLSSDTPKPDGFEQLGLQPVAEAGFTGERLEYRADSLSGEPDVGPWHVYDERFVAQDGLIYAVAAYGLEEDGGQDELELLTTALSGFCASYACDPASID
ncbi:hypothetical protein M2163_006023 [Streptomyces sp. SAI-135]|uniref:hypothetical protein n=1 Tax=unclassified Streptomyces TaxID=2593676 RepID=UPI002475C031|nr:MULTISPECIES: hypothetical protein [unclassified Streptomyces]MDH6516996.1 hypothetical protein [Streptomyces sp. SAI-090]MDH6549213.1 hypothetical protein [Streptomyces sp. SAI-041]MDH6618915.1 hypothetical protein [Streptomyces sp. SAI-135]